MLTKEAAIGPVLENEQSRLLGGRTLARLSDFLTVEEIKAHGLQKMFGDSWSEEDWKPIEWTEENVISQLRKDVEFGFEKALNKRGISASLMADVVRDWLDILEDKDIDRKAYAQYGLPLFKAAALKYGFENPIGDDAGDEWQYSAPDEYYG